MLLQLHVKNLALIREAEIDFSEGLNILTGETGAGKSLLLGGMSMALGGKVSKEMLRDGADYALAELVFSSDRPELLKKLEELDIPAEDGQIILSRRLSGNRSVCRLNGETVSASVLREVSSLLIDIHGQHEHQSLLNKKKHLEILDLYAGERLAPFLKSLKESWESCRALEKSLGETGLGETERLREQSLLEYEIREIEEAQLTDGEDEALEQTYRRMVNSRRILEALGTVRQLCEEDEGSASELTGRACREMNAALQYDEELSPLAEQLGEIDALLADFGRELTQYMEAMEFSEQDFHDTEERLNLINHLKAKYGRTVGDILASVKEKQERLDFLQNMEQRRSALEEEHARAKKKLAADCEAAHGIRVQAAQELSERMLEELRELNFLDVRFEIAIRETGEPSAAGWDDVEFLISTNPGEPLLPLARIASGGELSRVMLAIKTVLADQDAIDTVIFDEIDAGISGRTAQKVSEKLAAIGRSRQVICITHLAQLAAMADSHYLIEKSAEGSGTATHIRLLTGDEVTEELARILGGAEITGAVRDNAREMKALADQFKGKTFQ
ncbi:MAG: DNA repair protein RecN [Lachnospiraceae bacterium]|nr:DNA repair protein RecN [Lachnospiraceae bacterium]